MEIIERHLGKIRIYSRLLLKIMDFEGGIIWDIRQADEFGIIALTIEHPDLPLVQDAQPIPVILPSYTSHYGTEHSLLRIERVDPPKVNS